MDFRSKILKLAKSYGIPISNRNPKNDYGWNGKDIAGKNTDSNLLHDISHWLVATPSRRKISEFGLGPSPDTSNRFDLYYDSKLSFEFRQQEEEQASLLGILYEQAYGMNYAYTMLEHSWHCSSRAKILNRFKQLKSKSLWKKEFNKIAILKAIE